MLQETPPELQSQDKFYPAIQDFLLMYANNLLFPFAKPDNLIPILEITKIQLLFNDLLLLIKLCLFALVLAL